ncbi:MAG: excinuclease ABC subunit UvrC [Bacilli bacterium]|nr:excinuclease ABC subunit UvrC [Bacilli bacterium]
MSKIDELLSTTPHKPGCYLMKDKNNCVIYVGKSKNLKNRLSSYFKQTHTGKTMMLVRDIETFEYILTSSEVESLLLELNLIKKYTPKYNILYKDDKTYPYIELTNDKIPRLLIVRNPNMKRGTNRKLFGPYPNVTAAKKVVEILNRLYPLRKCKNMGKKECLYYHIGECLGYCINQVNEEEIKHMKDEIISFLNGNSEKIIDKLESRMYECSNKLQFEKAKEYKDILDYIKITLEKQKVELDDNYNRDIIGFYEQDNYLSVNILFIRGGKLLDKKSNIFPMISDVKEEVNNYISNFYDKHQTKVKEVLVPDIVDTKILQEGFNLNFVIPIKGTKKKILDLAMENAKNYYNEQISLIRKDENIINDSLSELSKLLEIDKCNHIELFDNSNIFGSFNVSGMVVFIDGKKAPHLYRKFKITNDKCDDYGTMREVIYRRYYRVLKDNLERPDLIIVDGGVGQINIAREVIDSLNLNIPVAGLKKDDKHSTNMLLGGYPLREIEIKKDSYLFHLLTKMQDEVHRYTITYHKDIRSKGALASILDNIDGIGEVRKKKILKKYHTVDKMKEASIEELSEIMPVNIAKYFHEYLNNLDK